PRTPEALKGAAAQLMTHQLIISSHTPRTPRAPKAATAQLIIHPTHTRNPEGPHRTTHTSYLIPHT
ncbi:MAG: hypothetical protein LC670_06510, partial [Flavobacteriales bacterium]|nr:hypothetical protein [Flavobacteriales bacterium]